MTHKEQKIQEKKIQDGLDNSMFGVHSGPFYTLEQILWFPDGKSESKRFNMNEFDSLTIHNAEWVQNPQAGPEHPMKMELWLHREMTLIVSEKPKHGLDEAILLWQWERSSWFD